jgi:integrase
MGLLSLTMSEVPPALTHVLNVASADRSSARRRQLRWVAGELALYAAQAGSGPDPADPAAWLSPPFVAGYLQAADDGQLRTRASPRHRCPDASRRVRRTCLRLLARAATLPDPVPDHVPVPVPLPRADRTPAALALAHLTGAALPADASPARVRSAALAALTRRAGLRTGELADLTLADLDLAAATLTYRPRPPAARTPQPPRLLALPPATAALLAHWVQLRAELIRSAPRTQALWVSLAANHDGSGLTRPPGLPLRPNGVRRAHARAIAGCNLGLAGSPGYQPLPRTLNALRPPPESGPWASG